MILATNGEPEMCLSANLTVMLYSPGAVGKYVTVHVPSLLSSHLISVFDGPSMARAKPPKYTKKCKAYIIIYNGDKQCSYQFLS